MKGQIEMEAVIKNNVFNVLKTPLILLFLCFFIWAIVFRNTLISVFSVWMGSNTYTHGMFVIPISLYFIYQRWPFVLASVPKPSYFTVIPMLLLQALWLLGYAADIELFKHAAIFGMLPCFIIMFFGWSIARVLWFPLIFIVFAIPIGEELIPYFQVITADISVKLLQLTGVPIYRDGLFITIPEGSFEVAEACSGIRFFIACIFMGVIISYVNYKVIWKRVAFLAFSVVLPIIANGIRVYGTIMVGHLIDMKYVSAADHLVYGWGFFAFIVLILVTSSRLGADQVDERAEGVAIGPSGELLMHDNWAHQNWILIAVLSMLPILLTYATYNMSPKEKSFITLDISNQPGQTSPELDYASWVPQFVKPTFVHLGYVNDSFDYYVAGYANSEPGAELVSDRNRLFDSKKWRYIDSNDFSIIKANNGSQFQISVVQISSRNGGKRLVAYWYYLPNFASNSKLKIKLVQALNFLLSKEAAGGVIALSIPYDSKDKEAKNRILHFTSEYADELENMIRFKRSE